MKIIPIGSGFLIAALSLFLFVSGYATEEKSVEKPHTVSIADKHPIAMAKQQLEQAREYYQKGDIDQVNKHLQAASQSLQGHKKNKVGIELSNEINQLQEKISHPSDEHEGAIARLWHRSSALVTREIEHATQSWHDSSVANETLKHLIDARMYFSYAEHDLFNNHNIEKANKDLENTLIYLDQASNIANPQMHETITTLKKEIQQLPSNQTHATESKKIIQALEVAKDSIENASHSSSKEIQARSKKIANDIKKLKTDVFILEKRQQYDAVMEKLQQLDQLL